MSDGDAVKHSEDASPDTRGRPPTPRGEQDGPPVARPPAFWGPPGLSSSTLHPFGCA